MTLTEMLERTVRTFPDKPAIVSGAGALTYREFDEVTNRLANMLLGLGVKPGDPVAVLMPPAMDWLIGYFGATKAGARVVILNAMLTPPELGAQLLDSGSTIVLTESRFAQALGAAAPDGPPLHRQECAGDHRAPQDKPDCRCAGDVQRALDGA